MSENPASIDASYTIQVAKIYLLLENPARNNNLGPILRCAAAFAIDRVIFVGHEKCSTEGSHGASKHLHIVAFSTFQQAVAYLRNSEEEGGCGVKSFIGILPARGGAYDSSGYSVTEREDSGVIDLTHFIEEDSISKSTSYQYPLSYPVNARPFKDGNVCFIICKNRNGLPIEQARLCDLFVHVPIISRKTKEGCENPISLLDPQTCLSIALHHFTAWAQYKERNFTGHKFNLSMVQKGTGPGSDYQMHRRSLRTIEKALSDKTADETASFETLTNLFENP